MRGAHTDFRAALRTFRQIPGLAPVAEAAPARQASEIDPMSALRRE